jgi:hypothetical protein|tara:strand:+ start:6092 stop:6310 length:219 start_codon:yes stop_codon:yes gene_type:complete
MAKAKKESQVEIIDQPDLVKDTSTQAVINTNTSQLMNRRSQMQAMLTKDAEIQEMKNDIKELKAIVKKLGSK